MIDLDIASAAPTLFVIGAAMALLPLLDRDSTVGRVVPCLLCIALMLRAVIWRATSTLPAFELTPEVLWAYVFFAGEVASVVSGALLLSFLSRTIDRRPQSDRHQSWVAAQRMRVDIFIATYNEEEAILDRTIVGAKSQDYEHFRVFVLDDGRRGWLRDLCRRRGVGYITRPDNKHAKAGNLNHGLRWLAEHGGASEYVAILDADFVPQPNFLRRALALFHETNVGCVQTPQHFFNPDPLQQGFDAAHLWPDEQRFFFDILLASKDAWGVAFSCGTSSICRVSAIEAIGGFPTESITEDMLLSVKLKSIGWRTVYLNERLSMGLAPEGLREYITQRVRWCIGFMQIARSAWGPFGSSRLPFRDRLSLVDSFMYWGLSFPFRVLCLLAPIVFGYTGVPVFSANAADLMFYMGPSLAAQMIVNAWISRGRLLPIMSDVTQLLIAFQATKAAAVGLIKAKGHKFQVTAKGGDRSRVMVQWSIMRPFVVLLVLTLGAILYETQGPYSPTPESGEILLFWAYYNALLLAVAIIACVELPRPRDQRFSSNEVGYLQSGQVCTPCQLIDLALSGATIAGRAPAEVDADLLLELDDVGLVPAQVTRQGETSFEVQFAAADDIRAALTRKLFSGRYRTTPERTDFSDVLTAVALRFVR
jgi:cellulose synthase (UDP-forming)